jgi:hypothetical protein
MADTVMRGDEGTYVEAQLLIMERRHQEETYYTFSYSPVPDDDGSPGRPDLPTPTTRGA